MRPETYLAVVYACKSRQRNQNRTVFEKRTKWCTLQPSTYIYNIYSNNNNTKTIMIVITRDRNQMHLHVCTECILCTIKRI